MHQHGSGQGDGDGLRRALNEVGLRWRAPQTDDVLLAIDDTDNLESPGTGFRARELAFQLARAGLARPVAITRHQLLVDPRIPYTSHNSSACLLLADVIDDEAVFDFGCYYLRDAAAEGSDAGLVLRRRGAVDPALRAWGRRAKDEVLTLDEARALGHAHALACAELTGTGGGLIGAIAAVGLHAAGDDGRLLWLRGLRELAGQRLSAAVLTERLGLALQTLDGHAVDDPDQPIDLGDWPRAVFRGHQPVLLVEKNDDEPMAATGWRSVAREIVKQF